MTYYQVIYYCDDDAATGYQKTIRSSDGTVTGAAEHVFEELPPLPGNIVGVVVVQTFAH